MKSFDRILKHLGHKRSQILRLFSIDETSLPFPLMQMLSNPFVFAIFDQLTDELVPRILLILQQIIKIIIEFDYRWLRQQLLTFYR
ncbi:hypothetical protein D3C77_579250 [compost metagenome]